MTFGAPMVVHSEAPEQLYRQLAAMENRAESSGGGRAPQLQFHNLVNNADVVPRLLGTSLDVLHAVMESYVPLIGVSSAHAMLHHTASTCLRVEAGLLTFAGHWYGITCSLEGWNVWRPLGSSMAERASVCAEREGEGCKLPLLWHVPFHSRHPYSHAAARAPCRLLTRLLLFSTLLMLMALLRVNILKDLFFVVD